MSETAVDYARYRRERAHEALDEADLLWRAGHINTCVNRLYYACFYAVSALLVLNGYSSATHTGTRTLFARHFVRTGQVSRAMLKVYSSLFHYRQESDYQDNYRPGREMVEPWLADARAFVATIEALIDQGLSATEG
jgi:uncharacterized protein (UPF0332 family)